MASKEVPPVPPARRQSFMNSATQPQAESQQQEDSSLYEKKWFAAFARLKEFKKKHGHCRVPNRYAEDPQLGNWVSTQRRQYRILTTGVNKTVPLTQDRAQQLIALGFEWSAKDPSHKCWEDRFQELCEYKQQYGSTLVPMGWKENPRLATWVSTQRQEYKQLKLGHSSRLNSSKVKLLNEIGFVWEAQRGRRKLPNPMERKVDVSEKVARPSLLVKTVPAAAPSQNQETTLEGSTANPAPSVTGTTAQSDSQVLPQGTSTAAHGLANVATSTSASVGDRQGVDLASVLAALAGTSSASKLPASLNQGTGKVSTNVAGRSMLGLQHAVAKKPNPSNGDTASLLTHASAGQNLRFSSAISSSAVAPFGQASAANADVMSLLGQTSQAQKLGSIKSQAASKEAKPSGDLSRLLLGSLATASEDKRPPDLMRLLKGSQTTASNGTQLPDLAKLLTGSQALSNETMSPHDPITQLVGALQSQPVGATATCDPAQKLIEMMHSKKRDIANSRKPPATDPRHVHQDQSQHPILSALGTSDLCNGLTLTPTAGAKRPWEAMLGLQGISKVLTEPNKRQRLASQAQNGGSFLIANAASAREATASVGGSSDAMMNVVHLYASSLPVNSPVRFALLNAPSVEVAESILKADIAKNQGAPSAVASGWNQSQASQDPGLQTLLQGLSNPKPQPAPAPRGSSSILETLQSLQVPGNGSSLAVPGQAPSQLQQQLQLPTQRPPTLNSSSRSVALQLAASALAPNSSQAGQTLSHSLGGVLQQTAMGSHQQVLSSFPQNAPTIAESDDGKLAAKRNL